MLNTAWVAYYTAVNNGAVVELRLYDGEV